MNETWELDVRNVARCTIDSFEVPNRFGTVVRSDRDSQARIVDDLRRRIEFIQESSTIALIEHALHTLSVTVQFLPTF